MRLFCSINCVRARNVIQGMDLAYLKTKSVGRCAKRPSAFFQVFPTNRAYYGQNYVSPIFIKGVEGVVG